MQPGPFPFPYSVFLGAALCMVLLMGMVLIFCPFGLQKENNPRTPGDALKSAGDLGGDCAS